jgi:heme-degrading monooxygenase HmoA
MYSRVVQFTGATDIDAGVAFVRETVGPQIRQQHGYRGLVVSADRAAAVFGVMSTWEDKASLDASDSALAKVRDEGQRVIGGDMSVGMFEQVIYVAKQAIEPGQSLLVRQVSMDPSRVSENLEFFRTTVLPELESSEGCIAVRQLIDRETGRGIVGTLWESRAAMEAAASAAEERRERAASQGVTFGEQTEREILLVDLP